MHYPPLPTIERCVVCMTSQPNPAVSFVQLLNEKLSSFIHQSDSRYVHVAVVDDGGEETMYRLLMTDNGWQLRLTEYEKEGSPLPSMLAASDMLDDGHDEPYYGYFQPRPVLTHEGSIDALKKHLAHNKFDGGLSRYQWQMIRSLNAAQKDTVMFMIILPGKNQTHMLSVGDRLAVGMKIGPWADHVPWTLGKIGRILLPRN